MAADSHLTDRERMIIAAQQADDTGQVTEAIALYQTLLHRHRLAELLALDLAARRRRLAAA
ncbi:MAG TPA: hypothetical protein VNF74_05675 [Terriglobales bacterium]|nr:hypothetical protein [Terriglobales bacterium]